MEICHLSSSQGNRERALVIRAAHLCVRDSSVCPAFVHSSVASKPMKRTTRSPGSAPGTSCWPLLPPFYAASIPEMILNMVADQFISNRKQIHCLLSISEFHLGSFPSILGCSSGQRPTKSVHSCLYHTGTLRPRGSNYLAHVWKLRGLEYRV